MTDLLLVLPDISIQPFSNIVPSLEKHSVTVTDILTCDAADLAKRAQIPVREVHRLSDAIHSALAKQLNVESSSTTNSSNSGVNRSLAASGNDLVANWRTISLLDDSLDATLGGGIPPGYVTEITGESGAGKTQLLLTLLLAVQLPKPLGLSRTAIYISTEAPLPTTRLAQLLSTNPRLASLAQADKPSLSRILSLSTPDLESQDHILRYQLPVAISRHNVGLVVIDSITANFRAEFDVARNAKDTQAGNKRNRQGPVSMARRSAQLLEMGSLLRDLARKHNIAIVVANQVADRFAVHTAYDFSSNNLSTPSSSTPSTFVNHPNPDPSRGTDLPSASEPRLNTTVAVSNNSTETSIALTLDYQQRFFTGWGASPAPVSRVAESRLKTPSLGLVWANQIACRIALIKGPVRTTFAYGHDNTRWVRHIKVVFAPWAKGEDGGRGLEYVVEPGGIRGVTKEKRGAEADTNPTKLI